MKKLHTMHDEILGVDYDVCAVSLIELASQIKQSYAFDEKEYFRFNTEYFVGKDIGMKSMNARRTSYQDIIREKERLENGIGIVYTARYEDSSSDFSLDMKSTVKKKEMTKEELAKKLDVYLQTAEEQMKEKKFQKEEEIFSHFAYEMFPIVVSKTQKGYELLDGYRRIFFTNPLPDREVLVKVYPEIDDVQWMKMMVMFNSWKFEKGVATFFDRGVSLGLYYRYGVDFGQYYSYHGTFSLESMLNRYIKSDFYHTLWGNDCFHDDMKVLKNFIFWKPKFVFQTSRKKTEFDCSVLNNKEITKAYPIFLISMIKMISSQLGKLRREETKQIQEGTLKKRKSVSFDDVLHVLQKEELQQDYLKMKDMYVTGHIENRLADKIIPVFSERIGLSAKRK